MGIHKSLPIHREGRPGNTDNVGAGSCAHPHGNHGDGDGHINAVRNANASEQFGLIQIQIDVVGGFDDVGFVGLRSTPPGPVSGKCVNAAGIACRFRPSKLPNLKRL